MTDLKTSILVNRQLPEFIRDEYPKFISFLEAYYEFLETKQITNSVDQKSDLINKSKDLRYITDVDASIDEFEREFTNTFIPYIPKDTAINKDFIIKNILPLYLSKGSIKSYQLLFRLLFDAEVEVTYPRDNILRASDGRWLSQNILRVTTDVYSEYVSDGIQTTFYTPYSIQKENLNIFIDGILIESGYSVRPEYSKIIFDTAVSENSIIKVYYLNFDPSVLVNRKITGVVSGTTALVERVGRRIISGSNYYELFVSDKTLSGEFFIGEKVLTDSISDVIVPITLQSYTSVTEIQILNGGSSYNVGDPIIIRGAAIKPAYAEVSSVASGYVNDILVLDGGVGFLNGTTVLAPAYSSNTFNAYVSAVDSTPENRLNTLSYNTDLVQPYENVALNAVNFGFGNTTSNIDSVLANTLNSTTIANLGSISTINIDFSVVSAIQETPLQVVDIQLTASQKMRDFGIIGLLKIVSGGLNYQVGDKLIFTNPVGEYAGYGANAAVSSVSLDGTITQIQIIDGGLNYKSENFPTITVSSVSGVNANIIVDDLMGANSEVLQTVTQQYLPGEILGVKILDAGIGYANTPIIDLTLSGDSTATATAVLGSSFENLPGRWTTNDGIISLEEIRLQGKDYYIDFSYVLNSTIEFDKYKSVLKNLLHPSGLVNYATYRTVDNLEYLSEVKTTDTLTIGNILDDARLNVTSGSTTVTGTDLNFIQLDSLNILKPGYYINVNSEIRIVSSIINSNTITVSEVFTYSSNLQEISVVSVPYNSVTTQTYIELATQDDQLIVTEE